MSRTRAVALALLLAVPWPVAAVAAQRGVALDVSLGGAAKAQRAALAVWRPLLQWRRAMVGAGLRASAYGGAPAAYALRGAASATFPDLLVIDPAVGALDLAVFSEFALGRRLALGFNLDLLGVAAGPRRPAGALDAEPQTGSVFRYGDADRGALNSEFYAALRLGGRWRVRAGASHYVTNYLVSGAGPGAERARYQRFETVAFVALARGAP